MPRWLGLTSPAMRSTASGTPPSHRDRQIKLLYPDRPLGPNCLTCAPRFFEMLLKLGSGVICERAKALIGCWNGAVDQQFLLQRLHLDFSVAPAELKSVERLKVFQNRLVLKF